MRRAKIVCTIGPASRDEESLKRLIDTGMDVARLNFSHGSRNEHGKCYEAIRSLSGRVAVMQDLKGPKIRVGEIEGGEMHLLEGDGLVLTTGDATGKGGIVHVTYPGFSRDVKPGDSVYLADGVIHLEVENVRGVDVFCRVVHGGTLSSRKGVNLPGIELSVPSLTEKDREDLEFGMKLGVDYVALSFVRSAGEVTGVKELLAAGGSTAGVTAKIEKREALDSLEEILDVADAVMIARGDLGVEISTEEVPIVQKSIIVKCIERGRPVITATQMLESMVNSERPTRAEASDVANAVMDGTDALMLSAETAAGRYPVESVGMMDRVIRRAEDYAGREPCRVLGARFAAGGGSGDGRGGKGEGSLTDAVCAGAVKVAEETGATAIACLTHSGFTARTISRYRPRVPILALTDLPSVERQMSLVWGVEAIRIDRVESTEKIVSVVRGKVKEAGYSGKVVITAGIPTMERGSTNTVHVVDI